MTKKNLSNIGPPTRRVDFDVIRVVATIMIIVFHFNSCFDSYDVIGFHNFIYRHANGTFGQVGVTMFWLLSGASLITRHLDDFDVRNFYMKRAKSIFPAYYISWIYAYIYMAYIAKHIPQISENYSTVKLLLTLTAMDGWLNSKTSTYFLVGEWFTGVIVIIYAIFPLLRWLYKKHFLLGSFIIFSIYFLNLKYQIFAFSDGYFSLSTGIAMFWLGMTIERFKSHFYHVHPLYYLTVFMILLFIPLPFTTLIELAVMGVSIYLFIYSLIGRSSIQQSPAVLGGYADIVIYSICCITVSITLYLNFWLELLCR